jgi:hypothetical protein
MTEVPLSVFVSCGSTYTPAQEKFVRAVESHLKSHGCQPQTVGRNVYSIRQPAEAVRDVIAKCDGSVVIAFERTRILRALEKPDSAQQKEIDHEAQPTVWNHMEAAMAYACDIPLLIFVEKGLARQGMLSDRLEWNAVETDLSPSLLIEESFGQVFNEWTSLMRSRKKQSGPSKNLTDKWRVKDILQIVMNLEAKDAWALVAGAFAVLALVAGLAFKVGQWADTSALSKPRTSAVQASHNESQVATERNAEARREIVRDALPRWTA